MFNTTDDTDNLHTWTVLHLLLIAHGHAIRQLCTHFTKLYYTSFDWVELIVSDVETTMVNLDIFKLCTNYLDNHHCNGRNRFVFLFDGIHYQLRRCLRLDMVCWAYPLTVFTPTCKVCAVDNTLPLHAVDLGFDSQSHRRGNLQTSGYCQFG